MKRSERRILVLGRPEDGASTASAATLDGLATVDVCDQVRTAVERVASACGSLGDGYDAILCQAERPEELSFVVRLRKRDPHAPILLVSGRADHPDFRELARRMGATAVVSSAQPPARVGKAVLRAAETGRAARMMHRQAEQARRTAGEIRALALRQRELSFEALRLARDPRS